jgi:hypothetical protein
MEPDCPPRGIDATPGPIRGGERGPVLPIIFSYRRGTMEPGLPRGGLRAATG